jgi:hypothetical protein
VYAAPATTALMLVMPLGAEIPIYVGLVSSIAKNVSYIAKCTSASARALSVGPRASQVVATLPAGGLSKHFVRVEPAHVVSLVKLNEGAAHRLDAGRFVWKLRAVERTRLVGIIASKPEATTVTVPAAAVRARHFRHLLESQLRPGVRSPPALWQTIRACRSIFPACRGTTPTPHFRPRRRTEAFR